MSYIVSPRDLRVKIKHALTRITAEECHTYVDHIADLGAGRTLVKLVHDGVCDAVNVLHRTVQRRALRRTSAREPFRAPVTRRNPTGSQRIHALDHYVHHSHDTGFGRDVCVLRVADFRPRSDLRSRLFGRLWLTDVLLQLRVSGDIRRGERPDDGRRLRVVARRRKLLLTRSERRHTRSRVGGCRCSR